MRVTPEELTAETGISDDDLAAFVEAGIVAPGPDGSFEAADLQRVRAVRQFLDAGVSWEHMRRAVEDSLITFEYTAAFFLDPAPRSGATYGDFKASLGQVQHHLPRVFDALGLAEPPEDQPMRRDADACLERLVRLWTEAGSDEALVRAARLLGDHVRATVDGWMALWSEHIGGLRVEPEQVAEHQALTLRLGRGLTDLLPSIMVWAEQRYLEQAMTAVGVDQVEAALAARGIAPPPERQPPAVMFVDLVGFSRLTEIEGDEAAVRFGTRLREVAEREARRHGGKLVKLLGDGAMLRFESAQDAVDAGCHLLTAEGWSADLPAPHIGIHAGPIIQRDGDIFGATVNIAARLSSAAGAAELLVSGEAVSRLLRPSEIVLEPIGELSLRNIGQPVPAFRARAGSSS
jgi:adenylate cyclase